MIRWRRASQGFTLIEMMVTVALIAIVVGAVLLSSLHRHNQSTIAGITAMEAAMEDAQGLARAHNGATIEIKPDPTSSNNFEAIVFAGTPGSIGTTLVQQQIIQVPMNLTTSPVSVFPGKWSSSTAGTIDIFVSSYGDTDFAQDWDPTMPSTQTYPGCVSNTGLVFSMNQTDDSKNVNNEGGIALACGQNGFTEFKAGTVPNLTPTPQPSSGANPNPNNGLGNTYGS